MANETLGLLEHHCGFSAHVRKNKNGRLYLNCPNCGLLAYGKAGGQDYILNNTVMANADGSLPEGEIESLRTRIPEKEAVKVNVNEKSGRFEKVVLKSDSKKPVTENKAPENEKVITDDRRDSGGIGSLVL